MGIALNGGSIWLGGLGTTASTSVSCCLTCPDLARRGKIFTLRTNTPGISPMKRASSCNPPQPPRRVLARPAIAQPAHVLRYVPQADLTNPDPVWSTATIAYIHGALIWDQLYSLDEGLTARPQMVAGEQVEDDGLTWRLTLRDGIVFHDDVPVRAQDCVASILRAGKRINTVQTLMGVTNEVKALDDKRIEFRLKKRFALLPFALNDVFVMPERIAKTDAFTQISEYVGSGPYRFMRDEWKPGAGAAYARNEKYVPRQEPINMWAGGKVANFDRIEWKTILTPPPRVRHCNGMRWIGSRPR